MKSEDFLLYPLANEEQPNCPACGKPMAIVLHEAKGKSPGLLDVSVLRMPADEKIRL